MNQHFLIGLWLLGIGLLCACGNIEDYPDKQCPNNGALGCQCHSNNTCDSLDDGTQLACNQEDSICTLPSCPAGNPKSSGCLCGGHEECEQGLLCVNGNCDPDSGQTLDVPKDPKCYTPCRAGYESEHDGYVACEEGLLAGCIGNAVCMNGTCVVPGGSQSYTLGDGSSGASGKCEKNADCPDFQACIANQCYSDCDSDADCREDRKCFRHACRLPCVTDEETCPDGDHCSTDDGLSGYCMPIAKGDDEHEPIIEGNFVVTPASIELNNNQITSSFGIVNNTPTFLEFTVRKVSHTEFDDSGMKIIDQYPLHWLHMGDTQTTPEQVQELIVGVDGEGGRTDVIVDQAANPVLSRWTGVIEVSHRQLGAKTVNLTYASSPEGRWNGKVYYFANFGTLGLNEWVQDRSDREKLKVVGNAFVRRWAAFADRRISLDEFQAVVTATLSESWRWPSVRKRCPNQDDPNENVACYLYDNPVGLSVYSDYLPDNPVPTGMVEFPVAMNLKAPDAQSAPGIWEGKIVSSESLQYAGDPAVKLVFQGDPRDCSNQGGPVCIRLLESLDAEVFVGGRYVTDHLNAGCLEVADQTFQHAAIPWLVPGFEKGTQQDALGRRYRYECRDQVLPFGNQKSVHALNASLAMSNPIPDGTTRKRRIELIDGALVNQEVLVIIFREHFPSFLDPSDQQGFSAYGYMELSKSPANLDPDDYQGSTPQDHRIPPEVEGVGCTQDLIDTILSPRILDDRTASDMGIAVVKGIVPTTEEPPIIDQYHQETVHYYCQDTDLFDYGGKKDDIGVIEPIDCPAGSQVEFFTLQGSQATQSAIDNLSCQNCSALDQECEKASCLDVLSNWKKNGNYQIRMDPVWRCADPNEVYCDHDRTDLRNNKVFYGEEVPQAVFRPLDVEIEQAFRYKTKFRNRTGKNIGFAPDVCIPNSDKVPYCYDPPKIEEIRDRVDCAAYLYSEYYQDLEVGARTTLREFLVRSFSYGEEIVPGLPMPVIHDGFERLYSELLIMMGDEAYTTAFKSRFDLAGMNLATFEGSLFEPDGIDLSGGAGYEMYSLYLGTQYYQMALDRFYGLSRIVWSSIGELPPGQGYITQATVTSYFDRLIRASAQKTRAWSEIAKRYQSFNRPDLARLAIERSYTSAYLESIILSRMMLKVVVVASPAVEAQIVNEVEKAQRTYLAALLDMRNTYGDITDNQTYFGFQPDYIPFPALNPDDTNAFDKVMERALRKMDIAAEKEQVALEDNRDFDVDAAVFQAELATIKDNFESELSEICGNFQVVDGTDIQVYPAIPRYAHLDERASLLGNPCGFMGNGGLHDSMAELEVARLDFQGIRLAYKNLMQEMADTQELANEQCGRIHDFKSWRIGMQHGIVAMGTIINGLNAVINTADRISDFTNNLMGFAGCIVGTATDCPGKYAAGAIYAWIGGISLGVATVSEVAIFGLQLAIDEMEIAVLEHEIEQECKALKIDTKFQIKALARRALELQLEAVKLEYGVKLALSKIQKLHNDAISLMAGQDDTLELMINVEAARNDPNVRIYRNDAIITADRTFRAAVREAYRATKVFEYYTSQSYADLVKLFLVRMVSHGDYSLEGYLADLEEAFIEFQEQYGNPDVRVEVVSLRDDVLAVPRLDEHGVALSEQARTEMLREKIKHVTLLDARGYIVMPFSTSMDRLSPLTRNHKLLYIESEIIGEDVGDALARLYLRQRGTGVIRRVDGDKSFFAFPERTAVIDAFFNGERTYDDAIYRNERLRERPLVNTGWELILNQKDEYVNQDLMLESLSDIRLYLYYTDFTEL